jgi:hypothetical protein
MFSPPAKGKLEFKCSLQAQQLCWLLRFQGPEPVMRRYFVFFACDVKSHTLLPELFKTTLFKSEMSVSKRVIFCK